MAVTNTVQNHLQLHRKLCQSPRNCDTSQSGRICDSNTGRDAGKRRQILSLQQVNRSPTRSSVSDLPHSGSTGLPKPIDITHAAMAVYDNQRQLPTIDSRKNLGYNLYGGNVYYTAFPCHHLAGISGVVTTPVFYHDSTVVLPAPDMPNNDSTAARFFVGKVTKSAPCYLPQLWQNNWNRNLMAN